VQSNFQYPAEHILGAKRSNLKIKKKIFVHSSLICSPLSLKYGRRPWKCAYEGQPVFWLPSRCQEKDGFSFTRCRYLLSSECQTMNCEQINETNLRSLVLCFISKSYFATFPKACHVFGLNATTTGFVKFKQTTSGILIFSVLQIQNYPFQKFIRKKIFVRIKSLGR
jgi:hypothetical protein